MHSNILMKITSVGFIVSYVRMAEQENPQQEKKQIEQMFALW